VGGDVGEKFATNVNRIEANFEKIILMIER
jgi:hypothetical protein